MNPSVPNSQIRDYVRRPKLYENIDGTGELFFGTIFLGFWVGSYLEALMPAESFWGKGHPGHIAIVIWFGLVLGAGYWVTRAIKRRITFPRTGYVAQRVGGLGARALMGLTTAGISAAIGLTFAILARGHHIEAGRIVRLGLPRWTLRGHCGFCELRPQVEMGARRGSGAGGNRLGKHCPAGLWVPAPGHAHHGLGLAGIGRHHAAALYPADASAGGGGGMNRQSSLGCPVDVGHRSGVETRRTQPVRAKDVSPGREPWEDRARRRALKRAKERFFRPFQWLSRITPASQGSRPGLFSFAPRGAWAGAQAGLCRFLLDIDSIGPPSRDR